MLTPLIDNNLHEFASYMLKAQYMPVTDLSMTKGYDWDNKVTTVVDAQFITNHAAIASVYTVVLSSEKRKR